MGRATSARPRRWKSLLLPPASIFWLGGAGLALLATPYRTLATALLATSLVLLYLLSLPSLERWLIRRHDRYPPLDLTADKLPPAEAVVILDSGRLPGAREYGGATVSPLTLERLRYGALLHRRSAAPILVTGDGAGPLMAEVLEGSFGVPVRWIEPQSRNTLESAVAAERLLAPVGIRRLYLVTHFWHMPRATAAFRHAGLEPVPAPMGFSASTVATRGPMALVPRPEALFASFLACHEAVGRAWYRLRHGAR